MTEIQKLDGGTYDVNTILEAIKTFSGWAISVGMSLAGVSLIIGFILYSVADIEQKARVKQRICQTFYGIVGIIISISIVNVIITLFQG